MKKAELSKISNKVTRSEDPGLVNDQSKHEVCEENYHSLFEQATDAIMLTDFDGNFKDVNSSLRNMFGYTKAELLKLNVRALLDPEQLNLKPLRFDLLAEGKNVFSEREMIHKNGTVIYIEANAKKFTDDRVLVIARDITERKKVEWVLKKSEANLHTIFDTTDTIYVLMDNQMRIISYNPRAFEFAKIELGHTIEISKYFLDYFPLEKRPALMTNMRKVLDGMHINYEVSYPQSHGLFKWYHVRMFPITKGDNKIYGLMMAASNITEKKLLEKELMNQKVQEQKNIIRAVLKAQEIERNKIGLELHDNVNQILSSIRLYLCLIENKKIMQLNLIKEAKTLIDSVILEIRVLCREQVTPQKKLDLKELVEGLIQELSENTLTSTIFCSKVSEHLPIDEDLKLNIYRIVQEQINNILKHAGASNASISINENEEHVLVSIIDDGRGFDQSTRRNGIGISNIINRIESFNGVVIIEGSPGNGCRMEISIPHCTERKDKGLEKK